MNIFKNISKKTIKNNSKNCKIKLIINLNKMMMKKRKMIMMIKKKQIITIIMILRITFTKVLLILLLKQENLKKFNKNQKTLKVIQKKL